MYVYIYMYMYIYDTYRYICICVFIDARRAGADGQRSWGGYDAFLGLAPPTFDQCLDLQPL